MNMNDDYCDNNRGFDEIESALLRDDYYTHNTKSNLSSGADLGKRINLSTRVENDITRSEKKGEKRSNNYGRDDRATSEQVLDPRTRLILFKLLSTGFLSEIDGAALTTIVTNVNRPDLCICRLFEYWQRGQCVLCARSRQCGIRRENLQNVHSGVQRQR